MPDAHPAGSPASNGSAPHAPHTPHAHNGHTTTNGHANHTVLAPAVGPVVGPDIGPIVGIEALTSRKPRRGVHGEPWRVAAVVPGFGKHGDVEKLLADFGRQDLRGIDFWVTLVDNATPNRPLSDVPCPANVRIEHLRLAENTGGAGGFNAGMSRVLAGEGLSAEFDAPDFVWLVDSDARVSKRCLRELVKAMIKHKNLCAAGSALVDPVTGWVYEIGGNISHDRGEWHPACGGNPDRRMPIYSDYLAACSALVRREAIEATGLMPEIFIHGDDVQWFLRLKKATKKKVAGIPSSRAFHPDFGGKFQTWTRYYGCRNSFACIDAMGLPPKVRYAKALLETKRAASQCMMGLEELAELHLQGIEDAAAMRIKGHHIAMGRDNLIKKYKPEPMPTLVSAVRAELARIGPGAKAWIHPLLISHPLDLPHLKLGAKELGLSLHVAPYWKRRHRFHQQKRDALKAMWRALIAGPTADVAIVPTGWPTSWFRGKVQFEVTPDGFYRREIRVGERIKKAASVLWRGWKAARRVERRDFYLDQLPPAPKRKTNPPTKQKATVEHSFSTLTTIQ